MASPRGCGMPLGYHRWSVRQDETGGNPLRASGTDSRSDLFSLWFRQLILFALGLIVLALAISGVAWLVTQL